MRIQLRFRPGSVCEFVVDSSALQRSRHPGRTEHVDGDGPIIWIEYNERIVQIIGAHGRHAQYTNPATSQHPAPDAARALDQRVDREEPTSVQQSHFTAEAIEVHREERSRTKSVTYLKLSEWQSVVATNPMSDGHWQHPTCGRANGPCTCAGFSRTGWSLLRSTRNLAVHPDATYLHTIPASFCHRSSPALKSAMELPALLGRWRLSTATLRKICEVQHMRLHCHRSICYVFPLALLALTDAAAQYPSNAREALQRVRSAWTVASKPQLRVAPADTLEFGMVIGLSVLPGGGIVLASHRSNSIQWFDARGHRTRSVGRKGGGPGEFNGVSKFLRFGDTLALVDLRGLSHLFAVNGRYVRSEPRPRPAGDRVGYFADGDQLISVLETSHITADRWQQTRDILTRRGASSSVTLGTFPSVEAIRHGGDLDGRIYAARNRVAVLVHRAVVRLKLRVAVLADMRKSKLKRSELPLETV